MRFASRITVPRRRPGPGGEVRCGRASPPVAVVSRRDPGLCRGTVCAIAALLLAAPAQAVTGDLAAYMRARAADAEGRTAAAAQEYARALAADAASPVVAVRAYREAVRAGDLALADRAAAVLGDAAPADAALLAAGQAVRDPATAAPAIDRLAAGQFAIFAPALRVWTGNGTAAVAAGQPGDAIARRLLEEARALKLIAAGDTGAGLDALRARLGNDQAAQDNRLFAARLLIAQGKADAARDLLTGDAPAVVALRARVTDRAAGAEPTLAVAASHLFARIASDLALGPPSPISYALLRAALRADPGNDRATILLAGALARDGATDQAVATLATIPADSIHAAAARTGRVQILAAADRDEEALAAARAAGSDSAADTSRLADLYLRLDRPAEAVPLYRSLVERAGAKAGWSDWLQLGAALELAGDWRAARPALERAVELGPDQPLALNHLGYSLTEHGERPAEARALLEKAARLQPDDAAIADSLGWSLYRRGEVARALPLIERAAAADPANPEIAEHLGDVLWSSGRRFEARYAWTAARQMAEEEDGGARLSAKIANGL